MPNTNTTNRNSNAPERDYAQEKALTESLLNQRIGFFLLFFVITLAAAVLVKSKLFFLLVLSVGTVICWVLALAIILTTKAVNAVSKHIGSDTLNPFSIVSILSDKISHWMIGYFLPVFCSLILTLVLLAGSVGYIDNYFIMPGDLPSVAGKIDNIKNEINKGLNGPDNTPGNHFKAIDSVITNDKQTRSDIRQRSQNGEPGRKAAPKEVKPPADAASSDSFKDDILRNNMQRFISEADTSRYRKLHLVKKPKDVTPGEKAPAPQNPPSQYFPSVDTVIAKNNELKLDKSDKMKEGLIIRDKNSPDKKAAPSVKPAKDTSKTKGK